MMKGWRTLIQHLLDLDVHVAIVSGGLQKTARDIAANFKPPTLAAPLGRH